MESILNTIFNTENVRTLVLLVSIFSCFVWLKISIKNLEHKTESSINELRHNDFAHLSNDFAHLKGTIEALTFVLEKNGSLSKEDKGFVDSRFPPPI